MELLTRLIRICSYSWLSSICPFNFLSKIVSANLLKEQILSASDWNNLCLSHSYSLSVFHWHSHLFAQDFNFLVHSYDNSFVSRSLPIHILSIFFLVSFDSRRMNHDFSSWSKFKRYRNLLSKSVLFSDSFLVFIKSLQINWNQFISKSNGKILC